MVRVDGQKHTPVFHFRYLLPDVHSNIWRVVSEEAKSPGYGVDK